MRRTALTPALMLIAAGGGEWAPIVMVAYGLPSRPVSPRARSSGATASACSAPCAPGGDDLSSVSTTTGMWTVAVCAIAVHIAIGYLIGNPWAIALAAAPALTLMPGGATGVLAVVTIAERVPIAAFITVGVLLKRHRETRFHTL